MDFFEARYFSSIQGRFTSVDPYNIVIETQYAQDKVAGEKQFLAYLSMPQQWNRYAYAINNPLTYSDPTGEAIELIGDKEDRDKALAALQQSVGPEAGKYLYSNPITDDKGNTRYFVGIYTNGPDGKGPAFETINSVAADIGGIITKPQIQRLGIAYEGQGFTDELMGFTSHVGKYGESDSGPGLTILKDGYVTSYILDPAVHPGYIPGSMMSDGRRSRPTPGELVGHELGGHGRAAIAGNWSSNAEALRFENKVRVKVNHKKSIRKIH